MDKKDKIVEILESWEKDNGHYFNSISESDYENIADEVVKLFAIPIVVGQSEQLKAFLQEIENDKSYIHNQYFKNKAKTLSERL